MSKMTWEMVVDGAAAASFASEMGVGVAMARVSERVSGERTTP